MIGASEKRSADFLNWESRGRGYRVWPEPVWPEPVFTPFIGAGPDAAAVTDDGRKETFFSSAIRRLSERLAPTSSSKGREDETEEAPASLIRDDLIEIQAHLPAGLKFDARTYGDLFASLTVCAEPITFEIVGAGEQITAQFVVHPKDERLVLRQLEAFLPDVEFISLTGRLAETWSRAEGGFVGAVEFGLGKEFMIPIQTGRGDPFVGVVGALSEIESDEIALLQVIFAPAVSPWSETILRSVTHADGSALFVNAPELLPGAREKTAEQLFAAVVRVAVRSPNHDRTWEIACNVAGALGAYGSPRGNELVPLRNDDYPPEEHETDVLRRQTHRSGMLLNATELAGFVHLPSAEVKSARLRGSLEKTKPAPALVRNADGLCLGTNGHAGIKTPVIVTDEIRVRHFHVAGASGTGKSTLLFNLIRQDVENGNGCSVLDPHGDLIDRVLGMIPRERASDVVLLDPSDEEYAVGFNILSAHSEWEKSLLASDLVSVFRRLSTSWGDQLNSVLSNALLAFMESDRGGTLLDVRRFLLEPVFRNEFLKSVRDSNVVYYWRKAFPALTGNKSVGPVITRLDTFLSPKALRYMVAQKENKLDFGDIMSSGKIFLAKLSEGVIGKENSHLLGSVLVSKIQSAAMSRQRQSESARRYHTLYADEFHNFLTPSLAECLSGVRKYRLGLVLAHQEMRQVERDPDVASALLNAGTRIVFRVNDRDARALESGFSSFEARDIQNLSTGHAICRVERSDCDFNLTVDAPQYPGAGLASMQGETVVAASRARYGAPRQEVERLLSQAAEADLAAEAAKEKKPREVERPSAKALRQDSSPEAESIARKEVPQERTMAPEQVASAPLTEPKPRGESPVEEEPSAIAEPAQRTDKDAALAAATTDLGRGGAQHKAVQDRIKEVAERLGFRVTVEKEVLGGAGQIDLVLTRDAEAIACEVTVTGTIDYEVGNVAKCLKAGFTHVAIVGVSDEKLKKLSAAVANSLGEEKAKCVGYYLPDAFIESLAKRMVVELPAEPPKRTRGGRVVKRAVVAVSPEEAKAKEEQALKLMADLMKKRKRT